MFYSLGDVIDEEKKGQCEGERERKDVWEEVDGRKDEGLREKDEEMREER